MTEPTRQGSLPQLYSLTAMGIGTFLGSALAAGYMLASNYAALGQRKLGQYVLAGSVLFVLLLVLLPSSWITSIQAGIVMMFIQVATVLLVAQKLQGNMFSSYEEMGGKYYSNWRAVVVGFAATLVLMVVSILLLVLFGPPPPAA